jgi:hypothetical protein
MLMKTQALLPSRRRPEAGCAAGLRHMALNVRFVQKD